MEMATENTLPPQLGATIRNIMLGAGGFFVGKGFIDTQTMTSLVGVVMYAVPFAWSLWGHRQAGIIAAAAALPVVSKIVTTPEIAHSPLFAADPTVVSPVEESARR